VLTIQEYAQDIAKVHKCTVGLNSIMIMHKMQRKCPL